MNSQSPIQGFGSGNQLLNRLVLFASVALVLVSLTFGAYYYWDRYVFLGDNSHVETNIEHLEAQVRSDPQNPEARVALAQYYLENGRYTAAIEQSQMLLDAYPESEAALYILGLSYTFTGQPESAIEPLENFIAARQEGPMAHIDTILESALYFLGQNYVNLNQPSKAIPVLSHALAIERTDADAMYHLALAYGMEGQHELAIEQYHNAVRFVPDFTEAYQGMAENYAALALPDHVVYAQGMLAFAQKDYHRARNQLEQAVVQLPDFHPGFLGLGLTYEQLGELELAQLSFERVLQLDPGNFTASNALGRLGLSTEVE